MFLKAMALGLSVPAAMRLARMATAQTAAAPKRFFLMYIPHGTAPEHFNPEDRRRRPAGQANYTTSTWIRPTSASWGRCSPTSSTSTSTRAFSIPGDARHPRRASSTACRARQATDTTTARTTVEHVIGKALNVKPLILGACSHITNGLDHERHAVLERHADRSGEEPGQGVRQPVRRRGRTAPPVNADVQLQQGPARVHRLARCRALQSDAAEPDRRADQAGDAPGSDPVAAGGREHDDADVVAARPSRTCPAWRWCAPGAPATCPSRAAATTTSTTRRTSR